MPFTAVLDEMSISPIDMFISVCPSLCWSPRISNSESTIPPLPPPHLYSHRFITSGFKTATMDDYSTPPPNDPTATPSTEENPLLRASNPHVNDLEQEVLDEYTRLLGNVNKVGPFRLPIQSNLKRNPNKYGQILTNAS